MKVSVLQEDLNKSLAGVGRVIPTRGQLPVLANVLLEVDAEGLKLSGTNMEIGMRIGVGGKTAEEGALTVPARSLSEFVASLTSGTVELTTEGDKLKVTAGKFGATMLGIGAAEFPVLPGGGGKDRGGIKIEKKIVAEIAAEVAFAAAADESRPVLTGIKFQVVGESLNVVGTDGFRMSRKTIAFTKNTPNAQLSLLDGLIIPARTILELARIVAEGQKESVDIEVMSSNNQVIFTYGKTELISRILEGNFPEVSKIIPAEHKSESIIDREELMRAVRAAAIFARDNNNIVKLKVEEGKLTVKAMASQTGESEMEVECESKGDDVEIAYNYRYVMDFLNSINDERVVMRANGGLVAGIWKGEKRDDLLHLIMPVRI